MGAWLSTTDATTDGSTHRGATSAQEHTQLRKCIEEIYAKERNNARALAPLSPPADQGIKGLVYKPFASDVGNPQRDAEYTNSNDAQVAVAAAFRDELGDFNACGSGEHAAVRVTSRWWFVVQPETPEAFMRYSVPEVEYDFSLTIFLVDARTGEVSPDHGVIGPFELDRGLSPRIRTWIRGVVEELTNCENIDECWCRLPWPEDNLFDGTFEEPVFDGDRSWKNGVWPEYGLYTEDWCEYPKIIFPNPRVPECALTAVSSE